jgi:hypothetical protein
MRHRTGLAAFVTVLSAAGVLAAAAGTGTAALAVSPGGNKVKAGDLLVSGTIFQQPDIVAGQTQLPPGCAAANCVTAAADGTYPQVFNNAPWTAASGSPPRSSSTRSPRVAGRTGGS